MCIACCKPTCLLSSTTTFSYTNIDKIHAFIVSVEGAALSSITTSLQGMHREYCKLRKTNIR